jgi:broad specificity phosphatase PhoE
MRYLEMRRHTMRVKPGQHLTQAGVSLARRVGETMGPFERVITSTIPRAYETAIAMGFAVDEQLDGLGTMDEGVDAEVTWDEGFMAWSAALKLNGVAAAYARKQAEFLRSVTAALADGGAALIVSHGGILEAGAVGCLPDTDHAAWGRYCSWCEGVRLAFDAGQFVSIEILRVE